MESYVVTPDFSEEMGQLKPGDHLCEIKDLKQKISNAGNEYIQWKLEVEGGGIVFHSTPLSGKGAGLLKQFIHATGDVNYQGGPIDLAKLIGKQVMCKLVLDEFESNGRKSSFLRVKNVWCEEVPVCGRTTEDIPF